MTDNAFGGDDCSAIENKALIQCLRQGKRKLSRMNVVQEELIQQEASTPPQHTSISPEIVSGRPGVASDDSGVESPNISLGTTAEVGNTFHEAVPTAPTAPTTGRTTTRPRTGRVAKEEIGSRFFLKQKRQMGNSSLGYERIWNGLRAQQ